MQGEGHSSQHLLNPMYDASFDVRYIIFNATSTRTIPILKFSINRRDICAKNNINDLTAEERK